MLQLITHGEPQEQYGGRTPVLIPPTVSNSGGCTCSETRRVLILGLGPNEILLLSGLYHFRLQVGLFSQAT